MRRFWTPERLAWLAATYRQQRIAKIPALFTAAFGLAVTESAVKSAIDRYKLDSGGRSRGPMPGERPAPIWFPERVDWLKEHREALTITPLTAAFNARFGTAFSVHTVANALRRYGIVSPRSGLFPPGQTPWNAGLVGYQAGGRAAETRWQPGNKVWHQLPVWSYRQDPDGYWFFKYREASPAGYSRRDWIAVHRLHWQDAHGPIPAGQVVILLDTDPNHTELDNLACLTRRELVIYNRLVSQVPPERELRRGLVARAKLLAGAYQAAERVGMSRTRLRQAIGALAGTPRPPAESPSAPRSGVLR